MLTVSSILIAHYRAKLPSEIRAILPTENIRIVGDRLILYAPNPLILWRLWRRYELIVNRLAKPLGATELWLEETKNGMFFNAGNVDHLLICRRKARIK